MTRALPRPGDLVRGRSGREYRLAAWHAEGSYSRVFRGEATGTPSAACAIKLAKPEVPEAAERLLRESDVRGRFRHARVPELLDTGCVGDAPFLALAWVEGQTLRAMIERQRRLPLATALTLLQDVAAVTAQMHREGFAHGDLRADNVLVTRSADGSRAMVADLGAAHRRGEVEFIAAVAGDTRQLGRLLYLMLTGTSPENEPQRLSTAHGYHPGAVRLWEATTRGEAEAASLAREIGVLMRQLSVTK